MTLTNFSLLFPPSQSENKMSITFQKFFMAKPEFLTPFSKLWIEILSKLRCRELNFHLNRGLLTKCKGLRLTDSEATIPRSLLDFHNYVIFHHQLVTEQLVFQRLSWCVPSLVPTPLITDLPLAWPWKFSHIFPIPEIWLPASPWNLVLLLMTILHMFFEIVWLWYSGQKEGGHTTSWL